MGYFTTSGYDRYFIFFIFLFFWHIYIFWIPCFALEIGQHLQRVVMP
jgi:hypothetical protein